MGFDADFRVGEDGIEWMPRPRPSGVGLLRDEVLRRASLPVRATRAAMKILGSGERAEAIGHGAFGFLSSLADSIRPASETPFNVPIGPHRRFDWTRFSIDHVSEVRERIGGTLNDVVLACVAGATRHYFERHQMVVDDIDFRAFVPVSTRKPQQRGRLGNHVSLVMVPLPLAEPEPRKRLEQVSVETQRVKGSGVAEGTELFEEVTDWTAPGLLTQMSRISATRRFFNMVVTNVPGPQQPVFMNGATMHEIYPLVPLFTNQALGVALFSYDGSLFWGFNADWDAIPDLHAYVELIDEEFETLRKS